MANPEAAAVSSDAGQLAKCVPLPGKTERVSWITHPLGTPDARVPGPTDHKWQGIAWLADGEAMRLRGIGTWQLQSPEIPLPKELAPLLDRRGSWVRSPDLEEDSVDGSPHFLLNLDANALYFWAVNPHCRH
ncbi:hypothetical protein ACFTXM_24150 [Streptomyces sp. NPDC056930]|uniref:hypothetical protein n=1 Tax=Streptomyces sp. NPDC056930 TaxID=3345967 RepID=UPI003637E967